MQVAIKRIDSTLPLPRYQTAGAAGFDFYAREAVTVAAHSLARIPSNFIIRIPAGFVLFITARSSLAAKKGLMLANGVGTIDSDFCGPADEILISVYNFTDASVAVERGERIAQGVFVRMDRAEWEEVEIVESSNRGGFGSTGMK
ncbi:MAG: dUTP diphosphatase [Patescibacteria group bacterium]